MHFTTDMLLCSRQGDAVMLRYSVKNVRLSLVKQLVNRDAKSLGQIFSTLLSQCRCRQGLNRCIFTYERRWPSTLTRKAKRSLTCRKSLTNCNWWETNLHISNYLLGHAVCCFSDFFFFRKRNGATSQKNLQKINNNKIEVFSFPWHVLSWIPSFDLLL